jgi:hypothetical protein
VRHWRSPRSHLRWVGATLVPLAIGKYPATAILATAAVIPVLVLVLVAAVVAMGAAFGRNAERRRACLHTLQTLLRLAPWTDKRRRPPSSPHDHSLADRAADPPVRLPGRHPSAPPPQRS